MARSEIAVGQPLAFSGDRFIAPEWGEVEVGFRGTFEHAGTIDDVDVIQIAARTDDRTIELDFGPLAVPFTQEGNVTGVFRGRAFATNVAFDGREQRQDETTWPAVELTVLPSLVVRAFEPKLERLPIVPPDAIAGKPFRLAVEAVGFTAASIEYQLGERVLIDGAQVDRVIHDVVGATDALGDRELLSFAPVPSGYDDYEASIVIRASSEVGEPHLFTLRAIVHRD